MKNTNKCKKWLKNSPKKLDHYNDYMVKCMKELAKSEPDIDALLPWNFQH
ncbi:hypothetical protein MEG05_07230 [Vibrio aestuarianus]|nr:hypothetical protein [Vibrio aestuarianus]MDE1314016.1 hypothetical protein [Vibrio aestuarianus]